MVVKSRRGAVGAGIGTGAVLLFALSGCSVTPTVSADAVASTAEDALEEQVGSRPDIDCGDDSIPLEEGTEVTCALTAEGLDGVYDAQVTLSDIEDGTYHVNVEVADQPRDDS